MLSEASCGVLQVRSTSDLESRSAWPSDVLGQAAAVVAGYQAEVPPVQDQERRPDKRRTGAPRPAAGLQEQLDHPRADAEACGRTSDAFSMAEQPDPRRCHRPARTEWWRPRYHPADALDAMRRLPAVQLRCYMAAAGPRPCCRPIQRPRIDRRNAPLRHARTANGRRQFKCSGCHYLIQPNTLALLGSLLPAEMEPEEGFEPSTFRLRDGCSASA
jgi:hypothetical protein